MLFFAPRVVATSDVPSDMETTSPTSSSSYSEGKITVTVSVGTRLGLQRGRFSGLSGIEFVLF